MADHKQRGAQQPEKNHSPIPDQSCRDAIIHQLDTTMLVEVKFLPTVGRYVLESSWHPSQQLDRQKDGSVVARFRLDDTREIKSWILGFGKHAFVLSPESLRQEIVGELQSLLDRYRRPEQLAEPGQP
jgi:predicted DNA-binding transcriptional regulator YafY